MRQIKFRAWDETGKEMLHFGLHDTDQGYHIEHARSIDGMPTMQFTGLQDRNGVDIYESDLLKDSELTYKVCYGEYYDSMLDDACYGWFVKLLEDGTNFAFYSDTDQLEVIGNIHESKN